MAIPHLMRLFESGQSVGEMHVVFLLGRRSRSCAAGQRLPGARGLRAHTDGQRLITDRSGEIDEAPLSH